MMEEVEAWEEAVDGKCLLDEIEGLLRRFVVLPKWAPETLALWIVHTYAFLLRDITTYLGIESPEKRCGKTTLLSVMGELVNRPVVASNISSPAFFRVIQETQPTLLIDEADTFLQGNDELRGILNSGYTKKTSFVWRVASEGASSQIRNQNVEIRNKDEEIRSEAGIRGGAARSERGNVLAKFSCWCPKAMAAIGRLPDTLADRCIVIRMQRKRGDEACERLRSLEPTVLKRKCVRFVMDHEAAIAEAKPAIPLSLNDRAADIWEPLLTLADLAGGEWPEKARQAAMSLSASSQESNPIASLLLDIYVIFTLLKRDRLFTREMMDGLNSSLDRPWGEMRNGKEIDELWLAQRLRPYGIRPRTMRIGEKRAKGYYQEDFLEVCRRYIPKSELVRLWEEIGVKDSKSDENGTAKQGESDGKTKGTAE
jgi:hypothetical protein